jgi:ribonuclease T1
MRKWGIAVVAVAGLAAGTGVGTVAQARSSENAQSVALAALPRQAQDTHRLILNGGPFPYPKDGIVFGNRERQLPPKARGYYREYTVKTPGSRDRGARRIVCGGEPPTQPQACYYTDDHYSSFRRIQP